MSKQVLFVCIFNLQRSVAAQHLFNRMLAEKSPELAGEIEASSAGFVGNELKRWMQERTMPLPDPLFGRPIPETIQAMLANRGFDVSEHRSRPVDSAILRRSDMIVPVLSILKADLVSEFPETDGKVFLPHDLLDKEPDFVWEKTTVIPNDRRYFDFVHNEPGYVSTIIGEVEEFVRLAFPAIVSRLLGRETTAERTGG